MEAYVIALKRSIPRFAVQARSLSIEWYLGFAALFLAAIATAWSFANGYVLAYGDAESHLNIAKRVIDSMTPGLAQLGGIWLPLPHVLLIPFVWSDFLWRTGLSGAIVSGLAFIVSSIYIYKIANLITHNKAAGVVAAAVFMTNPNVLYMQSTPMTELVLIMFFVLSSYYFILYMRDETRFHNLIYAAFFGFAATLSRYDGWALVLMEAGILFLYYFPWKVNFRALFGGRRLYEDGDKPQLGIFSWRNRWSALEGRLIVFSTLAFFGILLWLVWGYLILGDALYFTHSEFSAKSQQNSWYERGELPSYQSVVSSLSYYTVTSVANIGAVIAVIAGIGLVWLLFDEKVPKRFYTVLLLLVPYLFNVATLYLGQSVIFIPSLTPETFGWRLFNVRYGLMMVPFAAICVGYVFHRSASLAVKGVNRLYFRGAVASLIFVQAALYPFGNAQAISLEDGRIGLSSSIINERDAETWFRANYDHGILLADDFSRVISIVRSPVDMENIIYVGNKPYWDESLKEPEKHARWIIMQQGDPVWANIWENPAVQSRLFKYFNKVYTSDEILIFKRIDAGETPTGP